MKFSYKNTLISFVYIGFLILIKTWANNWEEVVLIENADSVMFANLFGALWFSSFFKLRLSITPTLYLIAITYDIIVHGIVGQVFDNISFVSETPFELSFISIAIHLSAPMIAIFPVVINHFGNKMLDFLKNRLSMTM